MRSKHLLLSALLLTVCAQLGRAQSRWEIALSELSYNSHYTEHYTNEAHEPITLAGNSLTAVGIGLDLTYYAKRDLGLPMWFSLMPTLGLAPIAGTESGSLERNGVTFTTQKENVKHTSLQGCVRAGWQLMPWFQPFIEAGVEKFTSTRTDQQNGTDEGTFVPAPKQSYDEVVTSNNVGFGFMGRIALIEDATWRVRYEGGYVIPQHVEVTNTAFDDGVFGQGTTGYTAFASLALETPALFTALPNAYWRVGLSLRDRTWNGDGRVGIDIFGNPYWPKNSTLMIGGTLGFGLVL